MGDEPGIPDAEGPIAGVASTVSGDTPLARVLALSSEIAELLSGLRPVDCDAAAWERTWRSLTDRPLRDVAAQIGLPLPALLAAITGTLPSDCGHGAAVDVAEAEPPWLRSFDAATAVRIDVRPMIAARHDPFRAVMAVARRMSPGDALVIDAPFNPRPLRRILGRLGFESHARMVKDGHVRVCCRRFERATPHPDPDGWPPARIWRAADGVHVDVRGLPPPQPLKAVLDLIDGGAHDGTVVVHHEREPLYLLPELAERGWTHWRIAGDPGEVRLLLRRGER
jgi:hypothetical protein